MNYDSILNTIRTKSEADQLKDEIEILLKSLFQSGKNSFEDTLKTKIRQSTAEAISSFVIPVSSVIPAKAGIHTDNAWIPGQARLAEASAKRARNDNGSVPMMDGSQLKEFLIGLKEELAKLNVFKVTLAFSPSGKTIDKLFSWVNINMGAGIVLDIEEDQSIMGGAVFIYNGKYLNLSLKKRMEEMFESKREEIASLLSS